MKYIVLSVCRAVVGAGTMEEECCCETIRITALMLKKGRNLKWKSHLESNL